jgi:hypothetical protein
MRSNGRRELESLVGGSIWGVARRRRFGIWEVGDGEAETHGRWQDLIDAYEVR